MTVDPRRWEHNLDVVRANLAAANARQVATQASTLSDDVIYEAPYYDLLATGKARVVQMYEAVGERFSSIDYRVTASWPTVDPDLVICEVRGDNLVRGSDHRYQNHYIMFVTLRDGLIVRWVEYSDPKVYDRAAAAGRPGA